jgi:predicted alpha/beta-fold hydrolase
MILFSDLSISPIAVFALQVLFSRSRLAAISRSRAFRDEQPAISEKIPHSLEEFANEAIVSFKARPFDPIGFLVSNEHFQTIVGSGALLQNIFPLKRSFLTERETWTTPDGDFFEVDYVLPKFEGKDIVIILHGLESSVESPLVTGICSAMLQKGLSCCLVSFRGCGGRPNNTAGGYHLGFTTDLDQVTSHIHEKYPDKNIYLCGFSLGGNVILKFLGELGERAWARGIRGSAVTCVPFDPVEGHKKLESGFNRAVYSEVKA